jgi:hypothetical protein
MDMATGTAVVAGVPVTVLGVGLALSNPGTDVAVFGWVLAFIGALSAVANLFLLCRRGR